MSAVKGMANLGNLEEKLESKGLEMRATAETAEVGALDSGGGSRRHPVVSEIALLHALRPSEKSGVGPAFSEMRPCPKYELADVQEYLDVVDFDLL